MKALSILFVAVGLAACAFAAANDRATAEERAPRSCFPRHLLAASLATDFGEQPISMQRGPQGITVELWASLPGSWTVVISTPDGEACIVASGDAPTGAQERSRSL